MAGLLAGACDAGDPAAPVPQACRLERVAELPMLGRTPYVVVPAQLNGQPVSMLIDTGNEQLNVTPRAVQQLHMGRNPRRRTTVRGLGGSVTSENAQVESFALDGVNLYQSDATVSSSPLMFAIEPLLSGAIGADTLADYDVELNFAARRVVLWDRSGCATVTPPWPAGYAMARLTRGMGSLMTLAVTVDGHSVPALLDTGASTSTIDLAAARQIGIGSEALSAARVVTARGADASDVIARVSRGHAVAVGAARAPALPLLVSAVQLPFADMLLGLDFFRGRDVWISYAGNQIFMR